MAKILHKLALLITSVIIASSTPLPASEPIASHDPLDKTLTLLAYCESRNNPLAYNADDGGSPSYGLFQFKKATWYAYIKQYGLFNDTEPAELMNLIWDRDAQSIVTKKILEESDGWKNWYICSRQLDIDKLP